MATPPTLINSFIADLWSNSTSPRSTASINRLTNDVLIAVVGFEDQTSINCPPANATGIVWSNPQVVTTASRCKIAVYTAVATSDANTVITFTESAATTLDWGARVFQWRGSDGVGVSNKGDAADSAASVTLTGVLANSAIVMIITDWEAGNPTLTYRTADAGTYTEVDHVDDGNLYTVYTGYHADAGAAGNKVVGFTNTTPDWSLIAVEVKGAAAGVVELDGISSAVAALTGTFDTTRPLDGTVAEIGGIVGSASVDRPLSGLTDSIVDFDGSVSVARDMTAVLDSIFDFDGDMVRDRGLDASVSAIFDFDGDLTITPSGGAVLLDGASSSVAEFDADLFVTRTLDSSIPTILDIPTDTQLGVTRALDGSLSGVTYWPTTDFVSAKALDGSIASIVALTGEFNTPRPLIGSIDVVVELIGNLHVPSQTPDDAFIAAVLKLLMEGL